MLNSELMSFEKLIQLEQQNYISHKFLFSVM